MAKALFIIFIIGLAGVMLSAAYSLSAAVTAVFYDHGVADGQESICRAAMYHIDKCESFY